MPYTTPASEFIYGARAVEAALRCHRRRLYKLYIYQPTELALNQSQVSMQKIAITRGVPVKVAIGGWIQLLDSVSNGRPHNGFVLEASQMPQLPITHLEHVENPGADKFRVSLDVQSEEEMAVNGNDNYISRARISDSTAIGNHSHPTISSPSPSPNETPSRYPLLILLDGIIAPNNVGAIIRSAYYLGVDGIIFAGRNSSPLTSVVTKAAAGAVENTNFFKVRNDHDFVRNSQANGWRFLAADTPSSAMQSGVHMNATDGNSALGSSVRSVLFNAPTVLMFGNESEGLMKRLKTQADGTISIPGARLRDDPTLQDPARVDSLNVSVAAAVLMEMLFRLPLQISEPSSKRYATSTADWKTTSTFEFN